MKLLKDQDQYINYQIVVKDQDQNSKNQILASSWTFKGRFQRSMKLFKD